MKTRLTINGEPVEADIPSTRLLIDFLRDDMKLTGSQTGCDTSQCGCCLVHVNGRAIKSCATFAWQLDGADVVTIEGLAREGQLHPMQQAFHETHALQCGYCTPGMIMSAVDMANRLGPVSDPDIIRDQLDGNICRCTGYHNIILAIQRGAAAMHGLEVEPVAAHRTVSAGDVSQ